MTARAINIGMREFNKALIAVTNEPKPETVPVPVWPKANIGAKDIAVYNIFFIFFYFALKIRTGF